MVVCFDVISIGLLTHVMHLGSLYYRHSTDVGLKVDGDYDDDSLLDGHAATWVRTWDG